MNRLHASPSPAPLRRVRDGHRPEHPFRRESEGATLFSISSPDPVISPRRKRRYGRRALGFSGVGLLCALAWLGFSPDVASQGAPGYQVITNVKNPVSVAKREHLADIFLKRSTRWETSDSAVPVDLRPDSATRRAFSRGVLGRSVAAVRSYWTQRIFSGRDIPPPELQSEEAVGKFVASHSGAVGYISPGPVPPGTKVLEVR